MKKLMMILALGAATAALGGPLEYVESTGTQWLDTGVRATRNTRLRLELAYTKTGVGQQSMGWAQSSTFPGCDGKPESFRFGIYDLGNGNKFTLNVSDTNGKTTTDIPEDTKRHTFDLQNGLQSFDGKVYSKEPFGVTREVQAGMTTWLFAEHGGWGDGALNPPKPTSFCHARIYACSIWEDGVLIRDFVPWEEDGVAGLRDIANDNRFYPAASNSPALKAGPAFDCERLEYVESTGSEWVDTGLELTSKSCVRMYYALTKLPDSGAQAFMGWASSGGAEAFKVGVREGKIAVDVSDHNNYNFRFAADLKPHFYSLQSGCQLVDDAVVGTYAYGVENRPDPGQTFWLLGEHAEWAAAPGFNSGIACRFYSCQIYEDGKLIRDFQPCRVNGEKVGLLDVANGVRRFYPAKTVDGATEKETSLGAGKVLDLRMLDYVESTGQEWIDTKQRPLSNTRLWIDFQYLGKAKGGNWMGWSSNSRQESFQIGYGETSAGNGVYKFAHKHSKDSSTVYSDIDFDMVRHTFEIGPGSQKLDDKELSKNSIDDTVDDGQTIYLFAQHAEWLEEHKASGSSTAECRCYAKMRCYGAKLWQGDVLVADYRPCLCNGRVGLWDEAMGVFVPSKTGVDFKHPLPDDVKVARLKYVDTDGSQWLESGVRPTVKTHLFADMAFTADAANQFFGWGSVDGGFTFEFGIREGCYGWSVNNATSYEKFETLEVGKRVKFDLQSGSQKLNGVQRSQNVLTKGVANDRGYESTLFLFARKGEWNDGVDGRYDLMWNETSASSYLRGIPPDLFCTVRFYGCQIWENGELVRDYIPAQIGDQIGVFDQVNRVFHNGTSAHPYVGGPEQKTGLFIVVK